MRAPQLIDLHTTVAACEKQWVAAWLDAELYHGMEIRRWPLARCVIVLNLEDALVNPHMQ